MSAQMSLPVGLSDSASFENFHAPETAHVVAAIRGLTGARNGASVFVSGDVGAGKTHLGWAACRDARDAGSAALYIPMRDRAMAQAMLETPPDDALVCLDDIDAVAGDGELETLLFHFVEHLSHASRLRLLVTGADTPARLRLELADLVSRLNAAPGYRLASLTDMQKAEALGLRARLRGISLNQDVIEYILRHHSRDTHALFSLLDRIDSSTLASQRRVTLPLVRDLLRNNA